MRISRRWTKQALLVMVVALVACSPEAIADSPVPAEEIPCRDYGSTAEAVRIAEEWIAGHKSQYEEVIDSASWENDLWSIAGPLSSSDNKGFAGVTLLPDGTVVGCEATVECMVSRKTEKPACPASQKRVATEAQAIVTAIRFLEEQGIRIDPDGPPMVYSRPAWWVFVLLEPPMPGGHYTLLISADGEVVDTVPGE